MKKRIIFLSLVSLLAFSLLTGCYTSFATVKHHRVYDEEVVYYDNEDSAEVVTVYRHYRPYHPTRFVYHDPYDYWYDEPVFFISIGYDYRPHHYINYYPYGGCIYPGWYPIVYRPYYVPAWYNGHHGYYSHHNYYRDSHNYQKRHFAKRANLPGRDYNRRDRRDGYNKFVSNKKFASDDTNYGRRNVSRRNSGIDRNSSRSSIGRNEIIAKRDAQRQREQSIKNRSNKSGSSKNENGRYYSSSDRSKKRIDRKQSTNRTATPKVEKRSESARNNYDKSANKKSQSKSKSYSSPKRETRKYKSENTKPSSSSNNRPKIREKSKSSSSKSGTRSSSSRSSYKPNKSSSKSSSGSSRSSYKSSKNSSKSSSSSSRSSSKSSKSSSKSSSDSSKKRSRR